ncbi:hypothetical protein JGI7_01321 [Candidatus Kryptonium thompsonii]|jgi:hypothetical protein|uniref:Permease n=1 Tax=Candidatus Kryptonium thompsonii TaxID=1633631 RepID=A0A0P1MDC0_9BACT|nr:permease [Candidatus Kryptonium thompsoni]CUS77096.1 hypothetical protein JGI15_100182 [Candidatus Kryptonium thompsoni]CUS79524.1 hypothetical protein JGI6_00630 [Candidatus Kryptonium thompsoni]CUS81228.1 hypothetical protein JGI14_100944 [Candidatus Kryptonium thompsoni]CUS87686.1 hypothetical protein JGI8_01128 [Candidatus Kryptonium thompsoni]CUS89506.1 hypothetical protein JGI7_01321 [Candidatus Kryptonium thompsoni]
MILEILKAGLLALEDYVGKHILTCLVPAFLLAGAIVSFINRSLIIKYLGSSASKHKAFFLSSISAIFLAACSCTIIPVASGLYYGGASVGAAFIVLWVAPAANILSLIYTGNILGSQLLISRIVSAFIMAWAVGYVMNSFFRVKDKFEFSEAMESPGEKIIQRDELILIFLILLSLLAPNYLGAGRTYLQKVLIWLILTLIMVLYAVFKISKEKTKAWLFETWFFVRLIFPFLLVGVFIVGVIGSLIPKIWVERWLGGNSLSSSFFATMLGAVSYFATLTEAPFVDTLMKMGMGKGPALALLLTGPGISLPNWIVVARVFGIKKALVYVPLIILLGTFTGWFFGNFIF